MAKKKAAHGGARAGAGRKPSVPDEGKAVILTASVPEGLVQRLAQLAEAEGWSRSKAVTEAVRLLLARKKR
jgi:hypothetical protein